ncbi:MAG: hypothetical protein MUO77_03255 [Anaerolineales bacterium]|nr:hypothetical protein [Anaerolineales bacterium]
MTTRTQLEETLAAQRARRSKICPPIRHKKGRELVGALMVIVVLAASGAALFFALDFTTPITSATATISPPTSPSVYTMSAFTTVPATSAARQVCTDIPNGRLHVRFAAGDGSEVRGYLVEGETVQVTLAPNGEFDWQMFQGSQWLHIVSPIAGWVNARFVCKQEK